MVWWPSYRGASSRHNTRQSYGDYKHTFVGMSCKAALWESTEPFSDMETSVGSHKGQRDFELVKWRSEVIACGCFSAVVNFKELAVQVQVESPPPPLQNVFYCHFSWMLRLCRMIYVQFDSRIILYIHGDITCSSVSLNFYVPHLAVITQTLLVCLWCHRHF